MTTPEWLPWLVAAAVIAVWRQVVLRWLRAGRLGTRAAAAVYAAIIPVLVVVVFGVGGRLGIVALVLAATGFALSYVFAVLSFPRIAFRDRLGP